MPQRARITPYRLRKAVHPRNPWLVCLLLTCRSDHSSVLALSRPPSHNALAARWQRRDPAAKKRSPEGGHRPPSYSAATPRASGDELREERSSGGGSVGAAAGWRTSGPRVSLPVARRSRPQDQKGIPFPRALPAFSFLQPPAGQGASALRASEDYVRVGVQSSRHTASWGSAPSTSESTHPSSRRRRHRQSRGSRHAPGPSPSNSW